MRARLFTPCRSEGGFTLTEILVVILIIGILAAIAIPTLLLQRGQATDAVAKGDVSTASRALVIYEQDHDTFACGDTAQCKAAMSAIDPVAGGGSLSFSRSGGSAGDPTRAGYRVTAPGSENRTFWVDQAPGDADSQHGCDLNGARDDGGCRVDPPATSGHW